MSNTAPQITLISDSLVQPGLGFFQHLLRKDIERQERIAVLCIEDDYSEIVPSLPANVSILNAYSPRRAGSSSQRVFPCSLRGQACKTLADLLRQIRPTVLYIDSLESLELYAPSSALYITLKEVTKECSTRIIALHHADSQPVTPTKSPPLSQTLVQLFFSSTLLHYRLHPTSLITHLATIYRIESTDARIFDFLQRFQARGWAGKGVRLEETDHLELGTAWDALGDQSRGSCVVQWELRGSATAPALIEKEKKAGEGVGSIKNKTHRGLLGLRQVSSNEIEWVSLQELRIPAAEANHKITTDPAQTTGFGATDLPFNLNLTDEQRQAKDSRILPYLPKSTSQPVQNAAKPSTGQIFYEPDKDDDLDEEEPDEDLEL